MYSSLMVWASLMLSSTSVWAQATSTAAAAARPSAMELLFPFALIFFVFWFFQARPQQKKMKEHQEFLKALKTGDHVVTSSGLIGEVTSLGEKIVTLRVADNVKLKVLKSQVLTSAKELS